MVALAALLVWLSSPRSIEEGDASLRSVAGSVRSEPLPDPLVAAASEPAAPDPSPVASGPAIEKVEVCGVGWVDAEADGAVDTEAILASVPMAEASARLLESVRGDGDYGAATALALQLTRGEGTASKLGVYLACAASPCDAKTQDRAAAASLFDQIANLASATSDPRAYSLALQLCVFRRGEGRVPFSIPRSGPVSTPTTASPGCTSSRKRPRAATTAAIDDALFHIGAAPNLEGVRSPNRTSWPGTPAPRPPISSLPKSCPRRSAALRVTSSLRAMASVSKSCSRSALLKPNRKELCEKVATTLTDRSDSVITMGTGSAIGRRLGWGEERFAGADAIMAAVPDAGRNAAPSFNRHPPPRRSRTAGCRRSARTLRYVGEVATLGEREYLAARIERSGESDEYLHLGRARHARIAASEAAEASQRASAPAR